MDRLSDSELFTAPLTFMGVPHGRPGPANKAAILGIPFDCGTNMRIGARGGPDSVRQQSALMRRFNPTHADFDPVAALGLVDCGNVKLTPSKIVDAFERTEQAVDRIVQAGAVPITIGGDGSVTVPVARAVGKKYPKMAALHIDSHTDSYPYGEEEKYNSATQFTHVAEEGLIDPEFSWHVGIRSTTYAQGVVPRAMSLGYKIVSLDELVREGKVVYDETDREIVRSANELSRVGVGARNLRVFRSSADREAQLLEALLGPSLRSRNPERRKEALQSLESLAATVSHLKHLLLVRDLRRLAGD